MQNRPSFFSLVSVWALIDKHKQVKACMYADGNAQSVVNAVPRVGNCGAQHQQNDNGSTNGDQSESGCKMELAWNNCSQQVTAQPTDNSPIRSYRYTVTM
jgi:hypothetical protein